MMRDTTILLLIFVLALAGVVTSLHLLDIKYFPSEGGEFCDVTSTFSCTKVNHSSYGTVFGFPTAGIGIVGYVVILLLCVGLTNKEFFDRNLGVASERAITAVSLFGITLVGLFIQVYFTIVEFFILEAFCVYCLLSQLLILAIFGLASLYYHRS